MTKSCFSVSPVSLSSLARKHVYVCVSLVHELFLAQGPMLLAQVSG